jgi:hypothetical protein
VPNNYLVTAREYYILQNVNMRDDLVVYGALDGVKPPLDYEDLLARSPQSSIFAHRWWLDAVAPGSYDILELVHNDEIHAAWPIVYLTRDDARHVYMPPLTQKLGILFAPAGARTTELLSLNQKRSGELIDRLGPIVTLQQNFHESFTDWLPFYWRGYGQTTRYTYVLENISDQKVLWDGMRPNHRRDIRRAARLGIRIKDDLELPKFLELNRKTFARQGKQPLASDDVIYRVDTACRSNAGRKIFAGVDPQGKVHAAVYIAWAGDTAYYLMGGSEPELRQSGAQVLVLWEAISFAGSVAQRFDFEGSMLPQIERVFRGFGATQVPYFSISKFPPPPTTLSGFVKASLDHRWREMRRTLRERFRPSSGVPS